MLLPDPRPLPHRLQHLQPIAQPHHPCIPRAPQHPETRLPLHALVHAPVGHQCLPGLFWVRDASGAVGRVLGRAVGDVARASVSDGM